jgi:hypothetical protein
MRVELLHHVQVALPAGAEGRAREFHQGVLGIPELPKPAESVRRGGWRFERPSLGLHPGVKAGLRSARQAHPASVERDLPALAHCLGSAGCECRADEEWPDFERIFVSDSFGHRVELLEPTAASA